jgi:Acyl-CoA dehydrogenase, middle domain/Acyl-CoA dehydrogenase, N-terminal domain
MLETLMYQELPKKAVDLRKQVSAFIQAYMQDLPASKRARSWMGFDRDFSLAMAKQGWVGLTLPKEYGGAGLDPFDRFVIVEEMLAQGAPVAAHWIADRQSGPLINRYGTLAQKEFYLPKICRAEAFFCIGMSEPASGSDLASIKTRATKSNDGWVLNGQKLWTSHAHKSQYMIALVRTSGSTEDRHTGLSQMIVDLSLPGVTIRQITDLTGDAHFNEVFFENVLLKEDALIGQEGTGWEQCNAELAFERSGPERIYSSIVLLDTWLNYLTSKPETLHCSSTNRLIGKIFSQLTILRAMSIATTAELAKGKSPVIEAALLKDMGTLFEQELAGWIADAIGSQAMPCEDPELIRTLQYTLQIMPSYSLRGGTREILRGMIARGLGLR